MNRLPAVRCPPKLSRECPAYLPFLLQDWGKFPVTIHTIRDRSLGIDGEFREVFVQQRPVK